MIAIIATFLRPFLNYIVVGAIVSALAGGFILKTRHDAVLRERTKVEQEKTHAINQAREAREALRDRCIIDPAGCLPDSWLRD
jgi:hypothetical protein